MQKVQLRGDTLIRWLKYNPILSEREIILVATDPNEPTNYNMYKIGDGRRRFNALPFRGLPAIQCRGNSQTDVMSQKAVTDQLIKLEETLKEVKIEIVGCNSHKQNTDSGTIQRSFLINNILLKCCCNGLVVRNECDCEYADFTVRDLYIKGKLYCEHVVEAEVEQVKIKNNLIILNDGETHTGVKDGFSGIEIDRGTEEHFFLLFEEETKGLQAGFGSQLLGIMCMDKGFQNGDLAQWDAEQGMFVACKNLDNDYMRMKGPFHNGSFPVWDAEQEIFVEQVAESGKNYMKMLTPFQEGEIPIWNTEQQLFVPGSGLPDNVMLKGEGFEDRDGVVWDESHKQFVPGIPFDPLCLRKNRIMVLSSLPVVGMEEGDIIILDKNAATPPHTAEELNKKNPYLMKSDIVDNVNSEETQKVLSARMGYVLSHSTPSSEGWGTNEDFVKGFEENAGNLF